MYELLLPGRSISVATFIRHPCDWKFNRGGKAPMTRVGLVACCNYRSRSSSPRRPHSQPDPVLNTIIVLFYNVINTIKIKKKNSWGTYIQAKRSFSLSRRSSYARSKFVCLRTHDFCRSFHVICFFVYADTHYSQIFSRNIKISKSTLACLKGA